MSQIKLVALDLDGTLFNEKSRISEASLEAIRHLTEKGIHVVISTGRPLSGLPFHQMEGTDINYAITSNGSAVYQLNPKKCIYENPMPDELAFPIVEWLQTKEAHIAAFAGGDGYTPVRCRSMMEQIPLPDSIKQTWYTTRKHVPDLLSCLKEQGLHLQKVTLNFQQAEDGSLIDRAEIFKRLSSDPRLEVVCGGFSNLEFTKKGVDKGVALYKLAEYLGVAPEETMAMGDTENDLAILRAAGVAVAMGNAIDSVKAEADFITKANTEEGVAYAIETLIP